VLALGLVGVCVAEDCIGDQCSASADDASLMQLAGVNSLKVRGLQHLKKQVPDEAVAESEKKNFQSASKPFIVGDGDLSTQSEGKLIINVDGEDQTYYLPGAPTEDDGRTVKFLPPYRYYMMNTPTTNYSQADNFFQMNLVGSTFSVDMYFGPGGASCGCNMNFYLVNMPASSPGQDNDYYCDAQCFPDMGCCAEYDMNEGNNEVQQITNHACTGNYAQHPDWACNKWGDPEWKSHPADFGPSSNSHIDSTKKYTFAQKFEKTGNDLTVTNTMSQEGSQSVVARMGPGNSQLNAMMLEIEQGMVFVTGYWFAPDMNWLDGEECGSGSETCNNKPVYLSNWKIYQNGNEPPSPPIPPRPTEAPSPSGGGNSCCWGGCGSCSNAGDYCAAQDTCTGSCGGDWIKC